MAQDRLPVTHETSGTLDAQQQQKSSIILHLERLSLHYGTSKLSKAEWKSVLLDFTKDLAPFDIDLIERGIDQYRAAPGSHFWPTPGDLTAFIAPLQRSRNEATERRADIAKRTAPRIEDNHDWTPEAIEKMKTDAAELSEPWRTIVLRAATTCEATIRKSK